MALYTIGNASTNSSRLTDLAITKDQIDLKTSLENLTLVLELQNPNIWKTNLSYTNKENNAIKVYSDVLNSISDTLSLAITTTDWVLTLDYTAASANPDLVFTYGAAPTVLKPVKLTLYFDKTMLHPKLTTEFYLN